MKLKVKHYVCFMHVGPFFSETTTEEIDSWNVEKAMEMAKKWSEHSLMPYAFYFIMKSQEETTYDQVIFKGGTYFINGVVETLDEIKAKGNPELISRMETHGWDRIVTCHPYEIMGPYEENDFIVKT